MVSLHTCRTLKYIPGADTGFKKRGFNLVSKVTLVAPLARIYKDTTRSQLQRTKTNNFLGDIIKHNNNLIRDKTKYIME